MEKPHRRFQFSLASLLLLTVCLASLCVLIVRWEPWVRVYSFQDKGCRVTMSPDTQSFVTTDARGDARLWETRTGRALISFPRHKIGFHEALNAAFSGDGRLLATSDGKGTINVWEVESGRRRAVLSGHAKSIEKFQFSKDGTRLLSVGYDRAIIIWDVGAAGALWQTICPADGSQPRVALSPDGEQVLVAEAMAAVRLYDVNSGKVVRELTRDVPRFVQWAEISVNGQWAIVSFDHYGGGHDLGNRSWTTVWNRETGAEVGTIDGFCVASHDGGDRMQILTLKAGLWAIPECRKVKEFPLVSICASFSPEGRRVVCSGGRTASVYDLASGRREYHVPTAERGEIYLLPERHLVLRKYTDAFVYDAPSTYTIDLLALTYPEPAWGHLDRPELWLFIVAGALWLWRAIRWAAQRAPARWRRRGPRAVLENQGPAA